MSREKIGVSLRRKQDNRLLHGRGGGCIGDLNFPHMRGQAFVRSPLAYAWLIDVEIPDVRKGSDLTAKDLQDAAPIRAVMQWN